MSKSILALGLEDWVKEQRRLLQLEKDAEIDQSVALLTRAKEEEREALGVSLSRVTVLEVTTGLFGRTILKLGDSFSRPLPAHKFTPGDLVGVRAGGKPLVVPKPDPSGAGKAAPPLRSLYDFSGVVTAADDKSVSIALDEDKPSSSDEEDAPPPSCGDRVGLDKVGDEVTHARLLALLDDVGRMNHGPAARLMRLLFPTTFSTSPSSGGNAPDFCTEVPPLGSPPTPGQGAEVGASSHGFTPFHTQLNESQLGAISAALRAKDVCMIHGPPGTGKTTTVVEYILQESARGRRVLATAPSNVAVDNMLERLVASGRKVACIRIGHPARMSASLLAHSLDAAVQRNEGSSIVGDVRKDLTRVQGEIRKVGRRDKWKKVELRREERGLRAEVRSREERIVEETLRGADVVLTTVTGAATKVLRKAIFGGQGKGKGGPGAALHDGGAPPPPPKWFDVVVVDEVAQAVEAAVLIPALLGAKLVVAGDHQQLPPTVISELAAAQGLSVTLADRLVALYEPREALLSAASSATSTVGVHIPASTLSLLPTPASTLLPVVHMLLVQYRMHASICGWASSALYDGRLVPHPSVAGHTLVDLPSVAEALGGAEVDPSTGERAVRVRAADVDAVRSAAVESARESRRAAAEGGGEDKPPAPSAGPGGRRGGAPAPTVRLMDTKTAEAVVGEGVRPPSSPFRDLYVDVAALTAPFLLIDTAGCGMDESTDASSGSTSNVREADVVLKHVLALLAAGVEERCIAVVTPYNAQVSLLRAMLGASHPAVEVRTVDGFQGQEREAIVLSLVRSNASRTVGFLSDYRRMNVGVTRARRHAALITDTDTTRADPFIAGLLSYVEEHGQVRSATDYDDTVAVSERAEEEDAAAPLAGSGCAGTPGEATRAPPASATTVRVKKEKKKAKAVELRASSVAAQALLSLVRKQLRAFMRLCDDSVPGGGEDPRAVLEGMSLAGGHALQAKLDNLPTALLASAAMAGPDVSAGLQKELATLGGARASFLDATLALDFPTSLTPLHRALVHRAATDLGLQHASSGEGVARRIRVLWCGPSARAAVRTETDAHGSRVPPPLSPGGLATATVAADTTDPAREAETWTDMLSQLDLGVEEEEGEDRAAVTQPACPPECAVAAPAQPMSLLAQLAADRASRGAPAASAAEAPADHLAGLDIRIGHGGGADKKRTGKAERKGKEGEPSSLGSHPRSSDGIRREFGVPVVPLKHMGALSSGVGAVAPSAGEGTTTEGHKPGQKGGGGKKGKSAAAEGEEDDELAFLDAVLAQSRVCTAAGCRQPTHVTGTSCPHCRLRFCYAHGMPEVHGCGDAARSHARGKWIDAGGNLVVGGGGGAAAPAPLSAAKRDALSSKLHKKIDGAAAERTKPKGAKEGKK